MHDLDTIGINATHINASTFFATLNTLEKLKGNTHFVKLKEESKAIEEVKKKFSEGKVIVGAGYGVGHSTDYDATIFAEAVGADLLINASNIDAVYSEDPKNNPNAEKLETLSHEEFVKIISKNEQIPGEYRLFDLDAAKTIEKIKLKTIFVDGNDPKNIIKSVEGEKIGTTVISH